MLLCNYVYVWGGYIDVFCVSRNGVKENMEKLWQCNPALENSVISVSMLKIVSHTYCDCICLLEQF